MTIMDEIKQRAEDFAEIRATLEQIVESEHLPSARYVAAEMLRAYYEAFARCIKGGSA